MTATDTGEALLQNIIDNRADDAARLVYADWLEENGEPARADFIRVQIELHGALERLPVLVADSVTPVDDPVDTTDLRTEPLGRPIRMLRSLEAVARGACCIPGTLVELWTGSGVVRAFVVRRVMHIGNGVYEHDLVSTGAPQIWEGERVIADRKLIEPDRFQALRDREQELLSAYGIIWSRREYYSLFDNPSQMEKSADFRRGFVEKITCDNVSWLRYGPTIVRCHPIVEVNLTDSDTLGGADLDGRRALEWARDEATQR